MGLLWKCIIPCLVFAINETGEIALTDVCGGLPELPSNDCDDVSTRQCHLHMYQQQKICQLIFSENVCFYNCLHNVHARTSRHVNHRKHENLNNVK